MSGLADLVIGISGNIGVGKTTFARALMEEPYRTMLLSILDDDPDAERTITPLEEEVDQKILGAFYEDQQRFALATQINFFNARLAREERVARTRGIVLIDRTIHEDYHVFGQAQLSLGNMTPPEFAVYEGNFRLMTQRITTPDVYIYFKADVPVLQQRIRQRARPEETGLLNDFRYLELLNDRYTKFFREHARAPVIEIDANKVALSHDGEMDRAYLEKTVSAIVHKLKQQPLRVKRMPGFSSWLSKNSAQAALDAIQIETVLAQSLKINQKIITVTGNIGLGKTTITRIIAHELGIHGSYELDPQHDLIDLELLHKFLTNKPRHCYDLQKELLQRRIKLRIKNAESGSSVIEDRSPEEDLLIFYARFMDQGYLTEEQYQTLQTASQEAYRNAPKSDLLILLHGTPQLSQERIERRARPEELNAWPESELTELAKLYEQFPEQVRTYKLHKGPIIVLDVGKIELTNKIHLGYIYQRILTALN